MNMLYHGDGGTKLKALVWMKRHQGQQRVVDPPAVYEDGDGA
jgi:hypothetical protein